MKKKLLLCGALTLAALLITYFYTSNTKSIDTNELIVGTNPHFPPFEYIKDGEVVGFDIELIKEIAQRIGKKLILKDTAFDTLLLEAQAGRIHMIAAAMTPTPERAKQVIFTKLYLAQDPLEVITLAGQPQPKTLNDLKGKEVVVNDGFTAESFMAKQPGVILKRLQFPAEAFLAVLSSRAYAYVSARNAVQPFFDQHGSEKFNRLTLPVFDSCAFAISKKHPELLEPIQKALDELENNGFLEKLKKKWHLL